MMEYGDFYDIAVYANKNWKGTSSERETACYAYDYYTDFLWSKENEEIAHDIKVLCKNLAEDLKAMPNLEEPKQQLYQIASELNLIDMDYADYLDTDEWLGDFL